MRSLPPPQAGEWRNFANVFDRLGPPLRPSLADVARFEQAVRGHDRRLLLLGVTPELAMLGLDLTAVDNSPRMLAGVWPGDGPGRKARLGDWTDLPFEDASFDAVIGDGALNSAAGFVGPVLGEIARVLVSGGKAAFRLFCSPDEPETLSAIRGDLESTGNVHALKWRVAMALAASKPDAVIPVRDILEAFNALVPDRASLAAKTGWSLAEIDTLDAYDGADHSLGFPTLQQMLALAAPFFGRAAVLGSGGYPLAERCPVVVWEAR